MSAERRTLAYISVTARDVAERLQRQSESKWVSEIDTLRLAEDVAWLARQVAQLAELIDHG